ncbi:MAG: HD domain-containing protein [Chloroflexi bacterium]|nr:HD domain-containing protein [Chloroflexota bacterium]
MRALYRLWQFGQYLGAQLTPADRQAARERLGPQLAALFERMTPGEQAHSFRVMEALILRGESDPDLLIAALLHDAGKVRAPVSVLERVAVVLLRKAAPRLAEGWSEALRETHGWCRAFVAAHRHAEWGAEMAECAGASPRAIALIRRHQMPVPAPPLSEDDRLLTVLQQADHVN